MRTFGHIVVGFLVLAVVLHVVLLVLLIGFDIAVWPVSFEASKLSG